ncbi:23S rRNA (guanosine(2251)-2'-O)-methyltransferase RlmB [Clostridium tetani]|uniref:23S rRNA (Guanosine(2251)-2'-O)-methyltransferase RlmB n=1 Tax=Clostridium tetani TaxID=1513 RepID=A0A4Q0VCX4_CLOTA|nr:23S rRNA (guanosine(2251)-2'-O)-methyltransferase RlmB [Clostridium tetani]RXI48097.1 23S rRNA (guanosine(2251)-2'-O)-methyltransferase RlmB [Clostridium tetani]BDR68363.1 23S rRNA (guanosine(2251)-2'-O)-methyltransferase RlmB [Clostridium tetani]BDR73922.1 23S rRNA (guanosine(2251)-2'-O)-methyltransferase RlmB [Clostridium tetani]BDR82294.1 23S rRNA (guanosine(2251)-2'-O)-methyltransferase RlmB [Clostridium tetani]BDR90683.1 23S rRNA (guanosine(2251)-2'-O)-methyltransferase RlmB [Clostridi
MREDLIIGRNAVVEALESHKTLESILISKGNNKGTINKIISLAKENRIPIKTVDKKKLDEISEGENHQGVAAYTTPYKYYSVEEILESSKGKAPFILILDEIQDPHNFGAIIRTAEVFGVDGIIIPKRRSVGITPIVYKSSVGAVEHVKIAKVNNINSTIDFLKENNIWIYGADMATDRYIYSENLKGPIALVVGSEGKGISKLTKEKCDILVKIPMSGQINSLNASVAGGIVMYEISRQRLERD